MRRIQCRRDLKDSDVDRRNVGCWGRDRGLSRKEAMIMEKSWRIERSLRCGWPCWCLTEYWIDGY